MQSVFSRTAMALASGAIFAVTAMPSMAQTPPPQQIIRPPLIPATPHSADHSVFMLPVDVSCPPQYLASLGAVYTVSMVNNDITLKFINPRFQAGQYVSQPPGPPMQADIGRLPSGNYTLTTVNAQCVDGPGGVGKRVPEYDKYPFTVTDARELKGLLGSALDYSGHWWDPKDPSWGLFISQDAKDNLLAAWFTYAADGKPAWYVFQPKWDTPTSTRPADLWRTSKPPGANSPPPGQATLSTAGTASLSFTYNFVNNLSGPSTYTTALTMRYKIGDEPERWRSLERFNP